MRAARSLTRDQGFQPANGGELRGRTKCQPCLRNARAPLLAPTGETRFAKKGKAFRSLKIGSSNCRKIPEKQTYVMARSVKQNGAEHAALILGAHGADTVLQLRTDELEP